MATIYVQSKYRTGFWIRQFIQFIGGLILIVFCFRYSLSDGKFDYRSAFFWMGCFGIVSFIYFLVASLFDELKQLTVTDSELIINYLVTRKKVNVKFHEMKNFTTNRITHRQGAGRTAGYHQLEIELTDGRIITFNEDQYSNFGDIKNSIYTQCQK